MAALDSIADHEGHPTRSVVGAISVVSDSTSELGEDEHQHIVALVRLFHVLVEIVNPATRVCEQAFLQGNAVGVRIVAAMLGVANAGPYVGLQHLSGPLHRFGEAVGGVFDIGRVVFGHGSQNFGAPKRIETGLAEVIHDRPASDGLSVHILEGLESVVALL